MILRFMKIGFSTFVMQGGRSGVGTYICNLIRFLQEADRENRYELLARADEAGLLPLNNPNFSHRLYPPPVGHPVFNLLWHNIGLPQKRYDLLHIPSLRRIPLLRRTRVVATVHDLAAFAIAHKYDPARMLFNRRVAPAMIRGADRVIAVSRATRDDLIRLIGYPEERITVIYSGVDHELYRPIDRAAAQRGLLELHGLDKPFIFYVSRLEHPAKNHIRLIEAFERFKLENDSAHQLVFAGADWSGSEVIYARAAESPVHDDIRFLGYVPTPSLPLLYGACDLMIYPSLFEGFGLPVAEALACGTPVACSDIPSLREIAGDQVPLFDPYDVESLFRALERAVSAGRSTEPRARGMELAKRFDWRETARQTLAVYRAAV